MIEPPTIRVATPQDAGAVSSLLAASYAASMRPAYREEVLAVALPLITRANGELLASGTYYVAEVPDAACATLIGCGGWSIARPGTGAIEPGLGHIRHFATAPGWTRRGVGRALYHACLASARAAGVRTWECYASLNAEDFYAALGFRPVACIEVALPGGVGFPAVNMRAAL